MFAFINKLDDRKLG